MSLDSLGKGSPGRFGAQEQGLGGGQVGRILCQGL